MLDEQRQFVAVPNSVSDYLQHNGIYLVLTGHQPCGDHPAILRSEGDRVLFINGDNSYANAQANNPYDTRGGASHALQITGNAHKARININAKLRDNSHVQTCLDIINGQFSGDDHIGTLLPGNELVQCQLSNGNYRTIHQKGFTVRYTTRSSAAIEAILKL